MTEGLIGGGEISRRRSSEDKNLVVQSAGTEGKLPVCRSGSHIEGCRNKDDISTFQHHPSEDLRKAYIETDAETDFSKFRVEYGSGVSGSQSIRFFKILSAFYINVEEVDFSVAGNLLSASVKDIGGIENMSVLVTFRDGSRRKSRSRIPLQGQRAPARPVRLLFLHKQGNSVFHRGS